MSIRGKKYPLYLLFIPVLIILAIPVLVNLARAQSDSQKVFTEIDFSEDPNLFAMPEDEIIAVFLETPTSLDEKNGTGDIGSDVIPYRYEKEIIKTFCWDDNDDAAEHSMTLIDSSGNEIVSVMSGEACVTETIQEGDYEMVLTHDGKSDKGIAIFIVPEGDKSFISTASGDTLPALTSILNTDKCIGCDLSDVNLTGADLRGVDLSNANLSNAILVDADLSGSNLNGANLSGADLSRANLKGATLIGADLTNAILINADLSDADFTDAKLDNADLTDAILDNAIIALPGQAIAEPGLDDEDSSGGQVGVEADETCAGGTLPAGDGTLDLLISGNCEVDSGTYKYQNVNIIENGVLEFKDDGGEIHFWAKNIIVENKGELIAGEESETGAFGAQGGKLTIYLYGADQGTNGTGVLCRSATSATVERCGIPKTVWDSNGASKQMLPGGIEDYFYQYGTLPQDGANPDAHFGYKVLAVSYGGKMSMFGKKGSNFSTLLSSDSGTSWARLDGDLMKTATQLKVDREVDWEVGDLLVVTTTDYLPDHSEVLEIIAPVVDKMTFNFKVVDPFTGDEITGGIQYPHNGTPYSLESVASKIGSDIKVDGQNAAETRAAVGLLTRSIIIKSAGDNLDDPFPDVPASPGPGYFFGGHTMVRQGAEEFKVQGVQFHQLGQGGKIGHYPVHFHLARNMPDGTFLKDSSIVESMTRWVTVHGTHDVLIARNVGYMSIGHGFYLEDGTEIDNKLYSNLGVLARAAIKSAQNPREVPGILAWGGSAIASVPYNSDIFNPTVFWIMNGWNEFEYNMAAGATGCGVCYWLLPGSNSGPSQGRKWESYASMQTGTVMMEGGRAYENNLNRAAMTPLKSFVGNYCTTAMMSFNTVGATDSCLGLNELGQVPNPNAPVPAFLPPAQGGKGSQEKETFYPKVLGGGGRFATNCPGTSETRDCGPSTVTDRCGVADRSNCEVTVLDKYTSSFHWPQQNFAAIWLRPQWYLYIDSFLSDTQNGGLGFVTGGDYTLGNVVPGQWQLATRSVFAGQTQDNNPYSSEAGPFNPLTSGDGNKMISGLTCDTGDANNCRSKVEGISMPLDNFAVNQRLFNIYDGPNYQDSNAYMSIHTTDLSDLCLPPEKGATGASKCPQVPGGVGSPAWMYTRVPGIPIDKTVDKCVLPNAAIGWKQPNGFYYPPAFHSRNLHFEDVDIRHYVLEPLWAPGTYTTIEADVRDNYCTFPTTGMFDNFSSVDRQTVVNDNDGSLTGLLSPASTPAAGETVSVNLDPFFNAPIEAPECESFDTAKTSPYEYITTVVYPGCAISKTCEGVCSNNNAKCSADNECGPGNTCSSTWGRPCSNAECYGVPLERQLTTTDDTQDLSTTGIRMAGMALFQRSMMTLNDATYYINTTVSEAEQRKSAKSLNVFKGGETYYVYFIYSKESTKQTYQIYVGESGFDEDTDVSFIQVTLLDPIQLPTNSTTFPTGWSKSYDASTGILTVTVDMEVFKEQFEKVEKDFCQPESFCTLKGNACGCSDDLTGVLKEQCENGNICGRWAGKDIDCPSGGCPGFSFKLPANGFQPDDKGNILISDGGHRPDPMCFPEVAPWTSELSRAATGVAGSCDMTPIDDPKFCQDDGGGGGGGVPPVGSGPDKDGDGTLDGIDVDSDNDGIPDSAEKATVTTNLNGSSSNRNVIIPADPDNDGIPNELDLDSDGDCLPDHLEAGGTNDADRDGLSDNFVDTDNDGHHDAHDADQGGTALPLPDTDGDEIPDFLDHDSDNDGINDTEETQGTEDANDDGVHDNKEDLNNDGFADELHPDTGSVCVILDTDGDGLPDHIDAVDNTQEPPADDPVDDGDADGDGNGGSGNCALASGGSLKNSLAGLAVYALIPAGILFRRKIKAISVGR